MTLALNDRVKETTTVTGTGTATLLGATTGFQSFAVIGNANTTYYCIADQGGANWEVGIGTYTASGTTLARTTVLASSNAGALVVFTTGVKDVFVTYPSEKGVWYDASGNVLFTGTTTAANLAYTGTLTGSTGILNIGSGQVYKDASGNVGIGTSSPSYKLSVNGVGNFYSTALGLGRVFLGDPGDPNGYIGMYRSALGAANSTVPGNALNFASFDGYTFNASATAFGSQTERMRIDSSGNVGIGTSSPSKKLEVAGADANIHGLTVGLGGGSVGTNTASGAGALNSNTTGSNNTASGAGALYINTTGSFNTASGMNALFYNTTGNHNIASGAYALFYNTTGTQNNASGMNALYINTTGSYNTASGLNALYNNTTGYYNTASGLNALYNNTTGSGNSAFNPLNSAGSYVPVFNPTTENNRFCMGSTGVTNAYIQVAWTVVSDARDKTNFAPVPHGLDFVNQLQPTAYQYKEDRETDVATGIVRYGFKAQDVLALEGDSPVIIDTEDLDKLRFNSDSLIPVLVNAIKELTARLQILEVK